MGNSVNNDDNLDANLHPNGAIGLRVFPDARIYNGGTIGSPKIDAKVDISLNLPVPFNTDLFLASFDVDDPSLSGGQADDESKVEDNIGSVNGHKSGLLEGGDEGSQAYQN